ncbi:hypothetical protein CEXT_792831 [Caerostris extrusa]|uniref:Uncharacterized protein n=1 Tax=Caerostris extrusa TaxID=172846 RepID=A0AAV4MI64_CAEEX|nr:hypothetical protein CEXT_792831 [Caerostris extrusa]
MWECPFYTWYQSQLVHPFAAEFQNQRCSTKWNAPPPPLKFHARSLMDMRSRGLSSARDHNPIMVLCSLQPRGSGLLLGERAISTSVFLE